MYFNHDALLRLLSSKDQAESPIFVKYANFLSYIRFNAPETHTPTTTTTVSKKPSGFFRNLLTSKANSTPTPDPVPLNFLAQHQTAINASAAHSLDAIIHQQSGEKWSWVGEVTANAFDAVNALEPIFEANPVGGIGRFGFGSKQMLQALDNSNEAEIIVFTKSNEHPYAHALRFKKNTEKEIIFCDTLLSAKEYSALFPSESTPPRSMTQILIKCPFEPTEQYEIIQYIRKKYSRALRTPLFLNEQQMNSFSNLYNMEGQLIPCPQQRAGVAIEITSTYFKIVDNGHGMNDNTLYRSYLNLRNSTKKTQSGGEGLYYIERAPDNTQPSQIHLVLAEVIVESLEVDDKTLPEEILLCLPNNTSISSSRHKIHFDNKALSGIEQLIDRLFSGKAPIKIKLILSNAIVSVLKEMVDSERISDDEHLYQVNQLKQRLRSKIEAIPGLEKTCLPRIPGCEYLKHDNPLYLDPSIFPDNFLKSEYFSEIKAFHPGSKYHRAYLCDFKIETSPSDPQNKQAPIHLVFEQTLLMDKVTYQNHARTACGLAALNLLLNMPEDHSVNINPKNGSFITEAQFQEEQFHKKDSQTRDFSLSPEDYTQQLAQALSNQPQSLLTEDEKQPPTPTSTTQPSLVSMATNPLANTASAYTATITEEKSPLKTLLLKAQIQERIDEIRRQLTIDDMKIDEQNNEYIPSFLLHIHEFLTVSHTLNLLSPELIHVFLQLSQRIAFKGKKQEDTLNKTQDQFIYQLFSKSIDATQTLLHIVKSNTVQNPQTLVIMAATTLNWIFSELHYPPLKNEWTADLTQHLTAVPCAALSTEQIDALLTFIIPKVASNSYSTQTTNPFTQFQYDSKYYNQDKIRQFKRNLILFGDFGLGEEYDHPVFISALYYFGASIHDLKPGTLFSKALLKSISRTTLQQDRTFWQDFWYLADKGGIRDPNLLTQLFNTTNLDYFCFLTQNYQVICQNNEKTLLSFLDKTDSDLISIPKLMPSPLKYGTPLSREYLLHAFTFIDKNIKPNTILGEVKKHYFLKNLFYCGQPRLPSFPNDATYHGIQIIGIKLFAWIENNYLSAESLAQLCNKPIHQVYAFWKIIDQIIPDSCSQISFNLLFYRVQLLCFSSVFSQLQLEELTSTLKKLPNPVSGILGQVSESTQLIHAILEQEKTALPDAITHLAEYFLVFGGQFPEDWLKEPAIGLSITVLGFRFGWYAAQGCLQGTNSLMDLINTEPYIHKPQNWHYQYWQFFRFIQPVLNSDIVKQPIWHQLTKRWLLLCEIDNNLPSRLLVLLQDQAIANQLINNIASPTNEQFNQFLRFFHEKDICPIQERQYVNDTSCISKTETETLGPIRLAELIVLRGDKDIDATSLTTIQCAIQQQRGADRQLHLSLLLEEQTQMLRSIISSQAGKTGLWIRELVQNSLDAMHLKKKEQATPLATLTQSETTANDSVTIEVEQYFSTIPSQNNNEFIVLFRDKAGMSLHEIINLLLIPNASNPQKREQQLIGEFGIGFFTLFSDADRVEIKTSNDGKTTHFLRISIQRSPDGAIHDLILNTLCEIPNSEQFMGTEIKRVRYYNNDNLLQAQLEGLSITQQILFFTEGLYASHVTYNHGVKTALDHPPIAQIIYNDKQIQESPRELLATVPVKELGSLMLYRQEGFNKHRGRVESSEGLFIDELSDNWLKFVPKSYQKTLAFNLILVLPSKTKLTSDRLGIKQTQQQIVQLACLPLFIEAMLYLFLQKNQKLSLLPYDYFNTTTKSAHKVSSLAIQISYTINQQVNQQINPTKAGNWEALSINDLNVVTRPENWPLAMDLLTLVSENRNTKSTPITLATLTQQATETLDACDQIKSLIQDEKSKSKPDSHELVIPMDSWTPPNHQIASLIKTLCTRTPLGFNDVIFYHDERKEILAYVDAITGKLNKATDKILYPIHINASTTNFSKVTETINAKLFEHLIYTPEETTPTLLSIIAHEAAHLIEFNNLLKKGLHQLTQYQQDNPHIGTKEIFDTLQEKMISYFLNPKSRDLLNYLNGLSVSYDLLYELIGLIRSWQSVISSGQTNHCTHTMDKSLENSFINLMELIVLSMIKTGVLIDFEILMNNCLREFPNTTAQAVITDETTLHSETHATTTKQQPYGRFFQTEKPVATNETVDDVAGEQHNKV